MIFRSYRLEPVSEAIELVPTADLHAGAKTFNVRRALAHRAYVLASPDRYTFSLADDMENATKTSVGAGVYEQNMSPSQQRVWLAEYYRPLVEAGKLLGIMESNHSARSVNAVDFSPQEELAKTLGVPFLGNQAVIRLRVDKQAYKIHAQHGSGGADTVQGVLRSRDKARLRFPSCDIYVQGHNHFPCGDWANSYAVGTSQMRELHQWRGSCGSFLDYDGSYAESRDYSIPVKGDWSFYLSKNTHFVRDELRRQG